LRKIRLTPVIEANASAPRRAHPLRTHAGADAKSKIE
jgi:hypothetical protein